MALTHPNLVEDRRDHVAVLRVQREEALGALSRPMVEALGEWCAGVAASDSVRAVVLTGTGRGFVAGADIGEYHEVAQASFDAYQRRSRAVFEAVARLPQPTIAAVNGYALGGGLELALCCDLIVASSRARFGLPEIKLGLLPGGGGTQRLARALGTRLTKELVLTGRFLDAAEADGRGLLARVAEPDRLLEEALDLAEQLAAAAPLAAREAKLLIDQGVDAPLDTAWTLEQRVLSALFATDDAKEGIQAFVDKRDPEFRGH